jgi:hypothetical protein
MSLDAANGVASLIMFCTGIHEPIKDRFIAPAAQQRVFNMFRQNFLGRFPDGFVISELEHRGETTIPVANSGPLRDKSDHNLNEILDRLASDF